MKKGVVYTMEVAGMGMPGSTGRRVECYRLGNWVCMTGQASVRLDTGELVGAVDPAGQARQSRSYFGDPRPCQTGVAVTGLAREEMLVELDAWGFIDDPA